MNTITTKFGPISFTRNEMPIETFIRLHPIGSQINYLGKNMTIVGWYGARYECGIFSREKVADEYIKLQYLDDNGVLRRHNVLEDDFDTFAKVAKGAGQPAVKQEAVNYV